MSGLFGGGAKPLSTSAPMIGGMKVQTSAYGVGIALVYGTTRIPGNLIWFDDFNAIAHTETQSSGGKGGGGAKSSNTTYTYQAAVAIGLCEGPISGIGQVWSNKDQTTLAKLGMTLFPGATPQDAWGYLTTYHPTKARRYPGTAYVAASAYQLTDSAELRNHSFEVTGLLPYGALKDADPKDVITDYLTHATHGAGFPSARLGSLTALSDYCVSHGLLISPAFAEQRAAHEDLTDLCKSINAEIVWSAGLLKIIPYGITSATGNGKTYTPDLTPQYDLTDDDFLAHGHEDPVMSPRSTPADAFNRVQVEFRNRANQYNTDIATAVDQADIELNGLRPSPVYKFHWVVEASIARLVAELIKQRVLYIRNTYEFRLGWKYYRLEPMDIVTLTDARLGLDKAPVMITEKEEDEQGTLLFKAEEFPWAVATPPVYPSQAPGGYSVNYNVSPGDVNSPVIFEPPAAMTESANGLEIWIATSGGADWGGCDVWVSSDNATYKQVGRIMGKARHGVLSATLPSGSDPDTTNTLAMDLTASKGELISGTQADADSLHTLCYVDGELIAYQTATLTAANKYDLTYLRRGAYGSPIGSHASGGQFARLDQAIFSYPFTSDIIGQPIFLKFCSVNVYGGGLQTLAEVQAYQYNVGSKSLRILPDDVTSFMIDGTRLTWAAVTGDTVAGYRIRYHQGYNMSWGDAIPLHGGLVTESPFRLPINPAGQVTLMIKAVDIYGDESALPAAIFVGLGDPIVANILWQHDFKVLGWPGTLTGGAVVGGNLVADSPSLMWSPNADTSMWTNDATLMWQGTYSEMTYIDEVIGAEIVDGSTLTIALTATGESIMIYYRPAGPEPMWTSEPNAPMWTNDSALMWQAPPDYKPWPGSIVAQKDTYQFKVITGFGRTAGGVTEFTVTIDAPDIIERFNDISISASGTRLPITASYRNLVNVGLTLQDDGGSAVTAKVIDKNETLGPLVKCFTSAGAATTGILDATVQGY